MLRPAQAVSKKSALPTVAISVAALMFTGTNPAYFATGVSILLVGTLILGLGGTLGSGFSGIIIAPRSGLAPCSPVSSRRSSQC